MIIKKNVISTVLADKDPDVDAIYRLIAQKGYLLKIHPVLNDDLDSF